MRDKLCHQNFCRECHGSDGTIDPSKCLFGKLCKVPNGRDENRENCGDVCPDFVPKALNLTPMGYEYFLDHEHMEAAAFTGSFDSFLRDAHAYQSRRSMTECAMASKKFRHIIE